MTIPYAKIPLNFANIHMINALFKTPTYPTIEFSHTWPVVLSISCKLIVRRDLRLRTSEDPGHPPVIIGEDLWAWPVPVAQDIRVPEPRTLATIIYKLCEFIRSVAHRYIIFMYLYKFNIRIRISYKNYLIYFVEKNLEYWLN